VGFTQEIKEEIMVRSARHCCVCHRAKGINLEVHHIKPKEQGGTDSIENAICLCFDCHADAGHYFAKHPKGTKLSPEELLKHRTAWFNIVTEHKIMAPSMPAVELSVIGNQKDGVLTPIFIKEKTMYTYRNVLRDLYGMLGKDILEYVEDFKTSNIGLVPHLDHRVKKIDDYDGVIDYMNWLAEKGSMTEDGINCQPTLHRFGPFSIYKQINLSNCSLQLKLTNLSPEVLEDYKLYLQVENAVAVDSVNKNVSATDTFEYSYNVTFDENFRGEFNPKRNVLVQGDSVLLDSICFRPSRKARKINIRWELFARNAYTVGSLSLAVKPIIKKESRQVFVEDKSQERFSTRFLSKIVIE